MRRIVIWIVACVLFLHTIHIEQAYSKIHNDYEWTFEPKTDGSAHVEAEITIGGRSSSLEFLFEKSTPVENMEAWEAETGDPIDISKASKGDNIEYTLEFKETKEAEFKLIVEYDVSNIVKELYDEVYYLAWNWGSHYEASHTATIILPRNHELLYTKFLSPKKVISQQGRIRVTFTDDVPEEESFQFAAVFSQKGVQLLKDAENNFNQGKYTEAKKAYEDAVTFYFQFSELYNKNVAEFILDLQHYVKECDVKLAEEKYEEAMAAFDKGGYTTAQASFLQAQNMFLSAGDSAQADECQDFIDQCIQLLEEEKIRDEAGQLFNEGVDYFDQQQYEEAKTKFEEALAKYTELQDEEKMQECQDWIDSCEKELKGSCLGSSLILAALLGASLISMLKSRQR